MEEPSLGAIKHTFLHQSKRCWNFVGSANQTKAKKCETWLICTCIIQTLAQVKLHIIQTYFFNFQTKSVKAKIHLKMFSWASNLIITSVFRNIFQFY